MKPLNKMTEVDNFPTKIVVHHTGGVDANPLADTSHHTFETIQSWHVNGRGWENIGYHWVIEKNGRVVPGRPETYHAAAASGHNTNSVHIVMTGNFDATLPTKVQSDELKKLMKGIINRHPIEKVIPHRLVANKTCYGMKLSDTWAQELLDEQDQVQCDANMKALEEKIESQESTIQLLIKLIRSILGLK